MTLAPGTRLGPYEILAPLGAGAMGEVYRARDTRLDRTVAVKVLLSDLSRSEPVRQRFEREARTISSLSHPHICALYDVGNQDGVEYLVMEFLEGETLADRLSRGSLPVERVLRYGIEIADALEKAHRQGIVHRDLKPGNIMLTNSGVKIVDFGLAKLAAPPPGNPSISILETVGTTLTQEGTILGTFQYMAPEQIEAREADARSDIFALGSVLYEMATGQTAFSGKSQASLIASILSTEPPTISSLAPMIPPALDRVVRTCLAKDPDDRWRTAHDVMLQLKWIAEGGSLAGAPAPLPAARRVRERVGWLVAAVLAAATFALAALHFGRPRVTPRPVRTSVLPPEKTTFYFVGEGAGPVEVSPNGLFLVFAALASGGKQQLWVRPLDSSVPRPMAGTENAVYPFWSPDGREIGFFADGKLKKIEVSGGPASTICDAPDPRGGTWNAEGVILFEPHFREGLSWVAATGGKVTPVTRLDESRRETTHRFPWFLPDGKHFLFEAGSHTVGTQSEFHAIMLGSLGGGAPRLLLNARSKPVYAAGHILFVRQRTLMAQPFDWKSGRLAADALPIVENVQEDPGFFTAVFSASANGVLAFQESGGSVNQYQLMIVDRSGKPVEKVGAPGDLWTARLSHDKRRVACVIGDPGDIWVHDLERRLATRLTFNPATDEGPAWYPDDSRILFASQRSDGVNIFQKSAAGTGSEQLLYSSKNFKRPMDISPDGSWALFEELSSRTRWDIYLLSLTDRKVVPFLQSEFDEVFPVFSPNGRWVAYASNESGLFEVYVQAFPGPGGQWQVSTSGGTMPAWRHDGKELFYLGLNHKLMSVAVKTGEAFESDAPSPLFEVHVRTDPSRPYDVFPDGQRFLVVAPLENQSAPPVTLIQNWTALLRKGR